MKLLDFASEIEKLERSINPFAFVILAHLKTMQTAGDPTDRCQWKLRLLRPLNERGLSVGDVRKLFRVLDRMMQLPDDLQIEFRNEIEQYEREKRMPYITSIERMAIEKGHQEGQQEGQQEGLLAGKIQILQRVLSLTVESEESLLSQPIDQLTQKLNELQQQFDSRNTA